MAFSGVLPSGPPTVHGLWIAGRSQAAAQTWSTHDLLQQSVGRLHDVVEQSPTQTPPVQVPSQQSDWPAQVDPGCTHAWAQKNEVRSQRPLQHCLSAEQSMSASEQVDAWQVPVSDPDRITHDVPAQQSVASAQGASTAPHFGGSAQRFDAGSQKWLQQS